MTHSQRRPRKSRSQWQDIITDFNQSQLPARKFCTDRDLAFATFSKWCRRFANPAPKKTEPARLIELIQPVTPEPESWQVELELGNGMILRVKTA